MDRGKILSTVAAKQIDLRADRRRAYAIRRRRKRGNARKQAVVARHIRVQFHCHRKRLRRLYPQFARVLGRGVAKSKIERRALTALRLHGLGNGHDDVGRHLLALTAKRRGLPRRQRGNEPSAVGHADRLGRNDLRRVFEQKRKALIVDLLLRVTEIPRLPKRALHRHGLLLQGIDCLDPAVLT